MREIKFRGKDKKTGEWRYGLPQQQPALIKGVKPLDMPAPLGYIVSYEPARMLEPFASDNNLYWYEVDPETIGEYIGRHDKNGCEIYEGDIVRINHPQDRTGDFTNVLGEVFWWDEEGAWYHGNQRGRPPKRMWNYCEVVGNIYENANLLEKEQ